MSKLSEIINALDGLLYLQGASDSQIAEAQEKLEVTFAEDYQEYLKTFGLLSAKDIELTGITNVKWLDVVRTTKNEREWQQLPNQFYVVESLHIDDAIIVQNSDGIVYLYRHGNLKKTADSLGAYLNSKSV